MRLFSLFLLTILSTTVLFNAVKAAADADIQRSLRNHHRNNNNNNNNNNIRRIQDESSNFEDSNPAPEPIKEEEEEETVDENNDESNGDEEDTSALDSNTSVEAEGENESESTNQGNDDGDDTSALDSNPSAEQEEDEQESEIGSPVESPVSSPVEWESSSESPVESPVSSPVESESVDSPVDAPVSSPVESESFDSPVDAPVSSPVDSSFDSPVDSPVAAKEEDKDQEFVPASFPGTINNNITEEAPSSSIKNDETVDNVSTSTETPTYDPTRYKEPSTPSLEYEPPTAEYRAPTLRPTATYISSDDDPLKNDVLDEADNMDSSSSEEWGWNDSTIEEIEHDKTVIIALSIVFGVMFFFSIFVAYQMLENPEGCCASICRISVAAVCGFLRCICYPCRAMCGCTGQPSSRQHNMISADDGNFTHDLELS